MENENVELPVSITLGGVTYTVKDNPELQKFIQEVSKVEKSKLYSKFASLKTELDQLKNVKVFDASEKLHEDFLKELHGTFMTKDDLREQLPGILKDVVQPILQATENSRLDELKQYRENLIRQNEGTCIPELVKGDTKEELDKALAESIRLRSNYPTPVAVPKPERITDPLLVAQARQNVPAAPKPEPVPVVPNRPSMDANNGSNVKNMSMDEFTKNRDNLEAQLVSLYGKGTL